MRFDRLQIPAFGPFTNLDMEFKAHGTDLHLIYGSNEAGKSSLLRAFRDLLFDIPTKTPDNFLHDYKKLRIKGEIVNRAGERLIFQRRKGTKNTLLDDDDISLPDNALFPFLGNMEQSYFSAMFGLGTKELREGAEQILRGEGDIGKALFSASMGGTPVQMVLAALTEESDRLFKGNARVNVSIRPTANKYAELLRKAREAAVSPEAWEKIEKELTAVDNLKTSMEMDISKLTQDIEWLSRCEDALPAVGRLSEEMLKLESLPLMPDVSSDFVERVRAARKAASDARGEVHRLTTQISKLETQLADCHTSPVLISEAAIIDRMHQDLRVYGERKNSLTNLETELAGLVAYLQAGMQNLEITGSISELENLRLNSVVRLSCEETALNLQKTLDDCRKHKEKAEDIKREIESREMQLKDIPKTDLTDLRDTLSAAAAATDASKTLLASESEVMRLTLEAKDKYWELTSAFKDKHLQPTGLPDDFDSIGKLSVPTKAAILKTGKNMNDINRDIKAEELKIRDGKRRIETIQEELGRMGRRGELPSEEALRKAREHRNYGWKLVVAQWKNREDIQAEFVHGKPLEEAFVQAIARADDIADQLREQAEAVAQAEEKRLQISKSEKQNQESEEHIRDLENKLKELQTRWEEDWQPCGITPRSPDEMEEWREIWSEFKVFLRQLRSAEELLQQKKNQVQHAKNKLAAVLSDSAEKEFELLFEKAKKQVQQREESRGRRIELTKQLHSLKSQLLTLEQNSMRANDESKAASDKWKALCQSIGLPENISPGSGIAILRERAELLTKFDTWKKLSTESKKTTSAIQEYEKFVNIHCTALAINGDTTEAQVSRLWNELTKSREAQTCYNQLAGQIEEAKRDLTAIQESSNHAVQMLEELTCLAKLEKVEELEPLLANLELRDQIERQIDTFRSSLSGLARGQSVDDFLVSIRAEDIETLSFRKDNFQRQKQEKEAELEKIREKLSELNNQRQMLEASGDAAANYRQEAESCAARLKQDASRFVRLRLAAHFLQIQIERFRKENQGPLLEKSGRIFKSITQGAFSGLGAEFNADDLPVLVGLRPDDASVPIEGMSDGSRDQLYLALRLAALDRYLEQHEPMPLILDDLLITFDDDRTSAILPQLADLAQRTQIFLFTHHYHLVELCRQTLGKESFQHSFCP
ncbi:MAG: AAA family ATPase [Desulfamplus sp.]|nr:AAA family ATPase [Desulfamplus sp.]